MQRIAFDETYRDPWEGQPDAPVVDMRQAGWRDVVRQKVESDLEYYLGGDPEVIDEIAAFGAQAGPAYYTACKMLWFNQQSMAIPASAYRDLLSAKRQRGIIKRLYRRYLLERVHALIDARQAARARHSRQHKRRLHR